MDIITKIDPDQTDHDNPEGMALCPDCGQKLFEVESLYRRGLIRHKCRRCRKYVRVAVLGKKD